MPSFSIRFQKKSKNTEQSRSTKKSGRSTKKRIKK